MIKNIEITGLSNKRHSISTIRTKAYGVICLSILFFYLIHPVLPFVEYAIDKDYISKNLCIKKNIPGNCCQGKCYLEDQLKKNGEPLNSNAGNNKKIIPDQNVNEHMPSKSIHFIQFEAEILLFTNYSFRIIDSFLASFFVPPKY